MLSDITINEFSVKDSFSFANEIRLQDSKYIMASFDVESLFSNIPLTETIQICCDELYKNTNVVNGLRKHDMSDLLSLSVKNSIFLFNDRFYMQSEGVAMGSPLGPTLANSFLCFHEKNWLDNCPSQFKPVFYRRYVDDIFLLFETKDHVKKFEKYLNSRHGNIKFTVEIEVNDKLSFLDIEIHRTDQEFKTSLYRKPTFSGIYTNFNSFTPVLYKRGLLFSLLYRVYNICSDHELMLEEIDKLKSIWRKNLYPNTLIKSCINVFFSKLFIEKAVKHTVPKKELFLSLPYLGIQSLQVRKRLNLLFKDYLPYCNLKIVFNSKSRLKNLFVFKDKIPIYMKSRLIYKFTCSICKVAYIGKTNRHFHVRYNEHLGLSKLTNKPLKYNKQSTTAVREHIRNCNHSASNNDFKIIGSDNNPYHLLLKESLSIFMEDPVLNKTVKSFPLELF